MARRCPPQGRAEEMKLSPKQLFELAWSAPIPTIAKELGMSGAALGKAIRSRGIPTPPRGHWSRVKVGCSVTRPELPVTALQARELVVKLQRTDRLEALLAGRLPAEVDGSLDVESPPGSLPVDSAAEARSDAAAPALPVGAGGEPPSKTSCFSAIDERALAQHLLGRQVVALVEAQLQHLPQSVRLHAELWLASARLELDETDPTKHVLDALERRR